MKIEDLIKVPSDFKKVSESRICETHENHCGTTIRTRRDINGQVFQRCMLERQGNGWDFYKIQNTIWLYPIKDGLSLLNERIAICRFSEKKQGTTKIIFHNDMEN